MLVYSALNFGRTPLVFVPGRPVNLQQTVKMADTDKTAARPDKAAEADTATPEAKPKTVRKRTAGSRTRRAAKGSGSKSKTKARASAGKSSKSSASGAKAKGGAGKKSAATRTRTRRKPAKAAGKAPATQSAPAADAQPVVRKRTKAQNRKTLQVELGRVQAELTELRSTFDGEVDIDPEEGDVEVAERTKNISLIQMLETRERQFLDALRSVEAGEYGQCKRCREDIHPERLEVIPDAKYCIRCQELVERSPTRLY